MPKKSMTILIAGALLFSGCTTGVESDGGGANGELTKEVAEKIISENFLGNVGGVWSVGGVELSRPVFLEVTDISIDGIEAKVQFIWEYRITGSDDLVEETYRKDLAFRQHLDIIKRAEKPFVNYVLLRKWDSGWKIEKWLSIFET